MNVFCFLFLLVKVVIHLIYTRFLFYEKHIRERLAARGRAPTSASSGRYSNYVPISIILHILTKNFIKILAQYLRKLKILNSTDSIRPPQKQQ